LVTALLALHTFTHTHTAHTHTQHVVHDFGYASYTPPFALLPCPEKHVLCVATSCYGCHTSFGPTATQFTLYTFAPHTYSAAFTTSWLRLVARSLPHLLPALLAFATHLGSAHGYYTRFAHTFTLGLLLTVTRSCSRLHWLRLRLHTPPHHWTFGSLLRSRFTLDFTYDLRLLIYIQLDTLPCAPLLYVVKRLLWVVTFICICTTHLCYLPLLYTPHG